MANETCWNTLEAVFKWSLLLFMVALLLALTIDLFTTHRSITFLIDVVKDIESYDTITIAVVFVLVTSVGVIINFPSTFLGIMILIFIS